MEKTKLVTDSTCELCFDDSILNLAKTCCKGQKSKHVKVSTCIKLFQSNCVMWSIMIYVVEIEIHLCS